MKPSETTEKTKANINKIFKEEKGEYICDFGVTNCAYSDKVFDRVICEVSDLQDELDTRFIDREELKEKIKNSKISMNIDTEYYDGCRYAIKEILKLLEE